MIHDPDFDIIDAVLAGNDAAFKSLVDQYKKYVYTITIKILLSKPEAEEAAQDSFVKAYKGLKGFSRESKFSTWLYRIAFNTAITYKRKLNLPQQEWNDNSIAVNNEGEQQMYLDDKQKYLAIAINRLSEQDRVALTLFYLKELSMEEIAEIMEAQTNTIKVRIHRARQRVAEELKNLLKKEALTLWL